ncbi:MAG: hypothetical protein K8S00_09160 [Bacteroidales bacterium]|nr:hypothetical protein [Bacteroidales bacterium]
MKKLFYLFGVVMILSIAIISCEKQQTTIDTQQSELSLKKGNNNCATIPGGTIYTSGGVLITPGFMANGYNYQAHLFNGVWGGDNLVMKWNDAWLSNKDCDGDGLLDRHFGFPSYIGSGAWLTNHWNGTYLDANGNECHWTDFIKIIAVPADATKTNDIWYNADGTEIGPVIWGSFAIIQEVWNDPCQGVNGLYYNSPDHPGLGGW